MFSASHCFYLTNQDMFITNVEASANNDQHRSLIVHANAPLMGIYFQIARIEIVPCFFPGSNHPKPVCAVARQLAVVAGEHIALGDGNDFQGLVQLGAQCKPGARNVVLHIINADAHIQHGGIKG